MSKGFIVVIECISSAVNLIKDIRDEGYEPILMEPYCSPFSRASMRAFHDQELRDLMEPDAERPQIIMACKRYEDTLAQMRKLSPKLIIPGSDRGIELATRLSHDLGLVGNDPANLPKMRNKFIAQQALKAAGIRHIEGEMVDNYADALRFFRRMQAKGKSVVVKPVSGISSIGVYICATEQELKAAFRGNMYNPIFTMLNGGTKKVLIQECINGVEYYCNSVSCGGIHRITDTVRYYKRIIPNVGKLYDYETSVHSDSPEAAMLAEYQLKVLDAIGVTYGAVHSEIMIDEDGPVLIEANCRLCGGNARSDFLIERLGFSESQLMLRSYLYPDSLSGFAQTIAYSGKVYFIRKFFSLTEPIYITKLTILQTVAKLPGFHYGIFRKQKGFFSKTTNHSTSLCSLFFNCKDEAEAYGVLEVLQDIEQHHPEQMYEGKYIPILCDIASYFMA